METEYSFLEDMPSEIVENFTANKPSPYEDMFYILFLKSYLINSKKPSPYNLA
jgi:hypothetical protein